MKATMKASMKANRLEKVGSLFNLDNAVGLILAFLILLQIEPPLWWVNQLNQPLSIVALLGVTLFLFLTMNPLVGLLFMIYIYELLRQSMSVDQARNDELARMNPRNPMSVEEYVIERSDYSRIKNQNENNDSEVEPILEKLLTK
jgi:hypothetical protein